MTRLLSDVSQLLQALVPGWAMPWVLVALGAAAIPLWMESIRGRQIKGAVRRMVRAERADRPALVDRALQIAGKRRGRLIGLVQEAMRYGQRDLVDEGLSRLSRHPRGRHDAAALRRRIQPDDKGFRDPIEASVRVTALLDAQLLVAADEQLTRARTQFPGDDDLAHLQQRLLHARAEASASEE